MVLFYSSIAKIFNISTFEVLEMAFNYTLFSVNFSCFET